MVEMKYYYTSTRSNLKLYTFEEALCSGYASDGGLFVPQALPERVTASTLQAWADLNYIELATAILSRFIDPSEIPKEDLLTIIQDSLSGFSSSSSSSTSSSPSSSSSPVVVPVVRPNQNNKLLYVVELFHGPTFCFKDLSLQFVIHLLDYFSKRRDRKTTLVVSTTGDTGPAAVQAVQDCNSDHLSILVHYPQGQISDFQRKQLTTCTSSGERVQVVAFEGGGDDMDKPIKNIMTDTSFSQTKERLVCGINSYNIARPLMQMIHFIWTYLRVTEQEGIQPGDPDFILDIVLPTGAMGNIAGGYMAKQIGVPIGMLCAGVNINDITHRAFQTGIVQRSSLEMQTTMSEAINIQLPYNLERLLFYLTEQNHDQVQEWYSQLERDTTTGGGGGCMSIVGTKWFEILKENFYSARVTDEELCETLRQVLSDLGYWADPHTGVAFCAAQKLGYSCFQSSPSESLPSSSKNNNKIFALLATASPCKFQSAITTAVGEDKWKEYVDKYFPEQGKKILTMTERIPVLYRAGAGKTLEENQLEWEQQARALIQGM